MVVFAKNGLATILIYIAVSAVFLFGHELHAAGNSNVLLVASSAAKEQSDEMIAAVEGQLSDLPVTLDVVWVDRPSSNWATNPSELDRVAGGMDPLVIIFWDPETPSEFFMRVRFGDDKTLIRRDIPDSERVAGFESMGLVIHALVDALLEDTSEAQNEDNATDPEAGESIDDLSRRVIWGPVAAYSIRTFSNKIKLFHGVTAGFTVRSKIGLGLNASYGFDFPHTVKGDDFDVEVLSHRILLRLGFDRPVGKFRLGAGLGFEADILVQTATGNPENESGEPHANITPNYRLIPMLYVGFNPIGPIYLFLDSGIFFGLRNVRYVAALTSGEEEVDAIKRVGPSFTLGASVRF